MDFQIACSTWVRDEDELVLNILRESDRWLTVEELAERTGLPPRRIEHTLKLLKQQLGFRKELHDFLSGE